MKKQISEFQSWLDFILTVPHSDRGDIKVNPLAGLSVRASNVMFKFKIFSKREAIAVIAVGAMVPNAVRGLGAATITEVKAWAASSHPTDSTSP